MSNQFKSNNKSIFKASGNLVEGFTVIPNGIMNNINIMTPDSFTIFAKILQYISNPDHKINIQGLSTQTGLSKDRVSKALKKLIEVGYIVRTPIKRGNLKNGYIYEVFDTPQVESVENTNVFRNPEIKDTEIKDTEFQDANKENNKNKNKNKKNKVVVVGEKETQLLEMYKSFKLEKRVRPQTTNLVMSYINNFTLEVFEQIFIDASEDSVKSKYRYLESTFANLAAANVKTLADYKKSKEEYKSTKTKKINSGTKGSKEVKTRFHNITDRTKNYTSEELEKLLKQNQESKFGKKDETNESFIEKSLKSEEYYNSLSDIMKTIARNNILKNSSITSVPDWIK